MFRAGEDWRQKSVVILPEHESKLLTLDSWEPGPQGRGRVCACERERAHTDTL